MLNFLEDSLEEKLLINKNVSINKKSHTLNVTIKGKKIDDKILYTANIDFKTELKNYVLMMIDPDAPSRKEHTKRFFLHYLNISGKQIVELAPPSPPVGSGEHRYYTLLYESKEDLSNINYLDYKMCKNENPRACFDAIKFINENNLKFVDMVLMRAFN